jgi:hypothetical protein
MEFNARNLQKLLAMLGFRAGASLDAASLTRRSGTSWNFVGEEGEKPPATVTLLAANHAPGFYRVSFVVHVVAAGQGQDVISLDVRYDDADASRTFVIGSSNSTGGYSTQGAMPLNSATTGHYSGSRQLYSDGTAAIKIGTTYTMLLDTIKVTIRARLEALGA